MVFRRDPLYAKAMARLALLSLTLSHFRSHQLTRLSFDGRPVAIYGANGAGKTNLLEAISLLSPGRGLRRAGAEELARRPAQIGWKIAATLETPDGLLHEIETGAAPGAPREVRINDKAAPQARLGQLARMMWLVPAMDRLFIEGAEGRRRFLDRITLSFDPSHAEASLAYERAMRERNRLLKDMVTDPHWYLALEAQMAETGAKIDAARRHALNRLAEATKAADSLFPAADLTLLTPEGEAAAPFQPDSFTAALAESRRRDLAAGRSLIGPHRADLGAIWAAKGVDARLCSTGEQKALLISLVLANARALAAETGAPPLLLLDEVAAHLDAGRRAALYDEICALGGQAFLTGTGPELFVALGPRADHLELAETGGQTRLTRL